MTAKPTPTEVLIVGGGVAAVEAALALHHEASTLVRTTLLTPNGEFVYRPAAIGEPFDRAVAPSYPLAKIAEDLDLRLHPGTLKWIDTAKRTVHTEAGAELRYDALLLAMGARPYVRLEHALTLDPGRLDFQLHGLVQDIEEGYVRSLALIIPARNCWPLPMYELALMGATRAKQMDVSPQITLITPEEAPLAIFGEVVSNAIRGLLDQRGVELITSSRCVVRTPGRVTLHPEDRDLEAERIVALPTLHGPALPGIPRSAPDGFITTDRHGAVRGLQRVFAAGDVTDFAVKHGGIAAQQADAAATAIARVAGAEIAPRPFNPTLHGLLWTGQEQLYMRARHTGTHGSASEISTKPLWQPPRKIHARYLGPYLESLDRAHATPAG